MPITRFHNALHRQHWLPGIVVMLLLALTLHQTLEQLVEFNKQDSLHSATHLQSQFKQMTAFLEAMRGQAEERLRSNPQSTLTRQLYKVLHVDPT